MRIAIDARSMGSRPSGIGMYLFNFLKELVECKEFEFALISDVAESEYIRYFKDRGVAVHTYGKHFYGSASVYAYFNYVKKVLKDIKPDLFWEVNTIIPVRLKGDFKTMITVHDMFPIDYPEYFGRLYSVYFKYSLKKTLKYTDSILYNSMDTRRITLKHFPKAAHIRSCMSYIIVPEPKPVTGSENNAQAYGDGQYFLYIGNMEKRKGVDLLLRGFEKYREQGGKMDLVLGGKMLEADIEQLVLQVSERTGAVTYESYVSDARKQELFQSCGAYVFPSKAEGFGIPVVEAMWYNKPVIVSNLPVFDEIAGGAVQRFDIQCSQEEQIKNLAERLSDYSEAVDEAEYQRVRTAYLPHMLSERVKNFILGRQ